MRLADVDGQEVRVRFVLLVDLAEMPDLAPEGRSRVTAEDEHERLGSDLLVETDRRRTVERDDFEVRCALAYLRSAAVHLWQRVPQKAISPARAAHLVAHRRKSGGGEQESDGE